jgi:hypothetical protein
MLDRKKRGRPPGGDKPGERVVDYPQLSVRVPRATLRKLRAAATVQRLSHAKVLAAPFDRDKAERARNKFIEIQALIDALDRGIAGEKE